MNAQDSLNTLPELRDVTFSTVFADGKPIIADACIGCGVCVSNGPQQAIVRRERERGV